MHPQPRLVATYYTLAGPVLPGPDDASPFSLRRRAEAAAKAGYVGLGMGGNDLAACVRRHGYQGVRDILAGAGIGFLEIECLTGWFDEGECRMASDRTRRFWLEAAGKLGVRHIKVAGDTARADWPVGRMADNFRDLCREAAEAGAYVTIEIFPTANIRDIKTGRAVVEAAAAPNGGLLLDIWHLTRVGVPYAEIGTIPPAYIKHVEIDDADAQVVGNLYDDTVHRRRLPGQGAFDIQGFLRAVIATGYDGYYGIEILSDENRRRTPEEAARLSFDAAMAVFARI